MVILEEMPSTNNYESEKEMTYDAKRTEFEGDARSSSN